MNISRKEVKALCATMNPTVEYYYQLQNQPVATDRDREMYTVLRALQKKLELDEYLRNYK